MLNSLVSIKFTFIALFRNLETTFNHKKYQVFHFYTLANNNLTLFNPFYLEAVNNFFQILVRKFAEISGMFQSMFGIVSQNY